MKAVITGATGYIGSLIARELVARGWELVCVVRDRSKLNKFSWAESVEAVVYDGGYASLLPLKELVAEETVVFHLATMASYDCSGEKMRSMLNSNLIFGLQLLEVLTKTKARYFINTSSYWQYDNHGNLLPNTIYAATKTCFKVILDYFVEKEQFTSLDLVLFDVYGPQDPRPKLFSQLNKAFKEKARLPMSSGRQLLDLVHVEDVVSAYIKAADLVLHTCEKGTISTYAICSNVRYSLKEVVAVYTQVLGKKVEILWGGRPSRNKEIMIPWLPKNHELLPGWRPSYTLKEGIKSLEGV